MWNQWNTGDYAGMIAETISLRGWHGDAIRAYHARPLTPGPHPGLVLIPHIPGWDEWQRECARRFAEYGYEVVCPDIYARVGTGLPEQIARCERLEGSLRAGLHTLDVLRSRCPEIALLTGADLGDLMTSLTSLTGLFEDLLSGMKSGEEERTEILEAYFRILSFVNKGIIWLVHVVG